MTNGSWFLCSTSSDRRSSAVSRRQWLKCVPRPYVGLSPDDAGAFGPEAELLGRRLPVKVVSGLPKGVAGLPSGLPGLEGLELPVWSRITRV